jgi:hypothetical protein
MVDAEVATLITLMAQYWPSFAPKDPDAAIEAWLRMLSDVEPEVAFAAVDQLGAEGREFAPSPGQVRLAAVSLREPSIPGPDEAWEEIRKGIATTGRYKPPPAWSHPAIAAVVSSIGWQQLCAGEEMILRAHILKLYPQVAERSQRSAAMPPAVGAYLAQLIERQAPAELEAG